MAKQMLTDISGLPVGTNGEVLVVGEDGQLVWEDYSGQPVVEWDESAVLSKRGYVWRTE
jgi:hypothetical protein